VVPGDMDVRQFTQEIFAGLLALGGRGEGLEGGGSSVVVGVWGREGAQGISTVSLGLPEAWCSPQLPQH
jgi:hypothetical protein